MKPRAVSYARGLRALAQVGSRRTGALVSLVSDRSHLPDDVTERLKSPAKKTPPPRSVTKRPDSRGALRGTPRPPPPFTTTRGPLRARRRPVSFFLTREEVMPMRDFYHGKSCLYMIAQARDKTLNDESESASGGGGTKGGGLLE